MAVDEAKKPLTDQKKIDWTWTHKNQVVDFVRRFYRNSYDWRNQGKDALHPKWDRWERNYHNIYDPNIKAKKETWQCTMFIPETVKNVEIIISATFKILMGKKKPMVFEPRELGDELQAELNTSILEYEMDKSSYVEEFYKTLKEAGIFGSGFMKFYYEKRYDNRRLKKPVKRGFVGTAKELMGGNMASPNDVVGYKEEIKSVKTVDKICTENVHIRDIFIEPNSKDLSRVLHRQRITYSELMRMAKDGLIDKDSVDDLLRVKESDSFDLDIAPVQYDLGATDPELQRVDYDKQHTVWEYWGPIPRKWTRDGLNMPEDTEDQRAKANEIVEGKCLIASANYFLDSDVNPLQSMTHPFLQLDYIKCGQSYGKGIAQLMEGLQEEYNEIRNLRVDNVNLIINKSMVYVENYIRDPNQIRSSPGALIGLKGNIVDDVKKAIMPIEWPQMDIASYRETVELSSQIQETTGANKVTVGQTGKDVNQTLGGMELLRQAAYDRFSVGAFIMGGFLRQSSLKIMELSYQNSDPERIHKILGDQPIEVLPGVIVARWMTYRPIDPHELYEMYDLVPADVFEMENKAMKVQQLSSFAQLLSSTLPQFDPKPILKRIAHYNEVDSSELEEIFSGLPPGSLPTPLAQGQGVPSISKSGAAPTGDVAPPSSNSAMGTPG